MGNQITKLLLYYFSVKLGSCKIIFNVCACMELLTLGLDPSQYTFDQGSFRFAFRNFLLENKVQFLDGTYTPRPVEITNISVDWGYKWPDKFANLIEQYKEKCSKENTNESYVTL